MHRNSNADSKILFDTDRSPFSASIDSVTGFLTAQVNLSRVGVQKYYGHELGMTDRINDVIGVFRPREEVFNKDSVSGFVNLIITDDHPSDLVTVDNVKSLWKGSVSDVTPDGEVLRGIATITDKDLIRLIQSGKREVSVGYTHNLLPEQGTYDGMDYEFKQTDIKPNHLAIVEAGRCGSACKLSVDDDGKERNLKMFKITIDSIQYDIESAELAQAVEKKINRLKDSEEEMKKKMDEMEEEKKKAEQEKDSAQAKLDAMQKDAVTDDKINNLVAERAALIADAKDVLGDKMPKCMDCPAEMKAAVIDQLIPGMDLSEKSDDYVNAAFDMAMKKFRDAKSANEKLADDIGSKNLNNETRDSAREKYMKDQLGLTV